MRNISCHLLSCRFLDRLILRPRRWRRCSSETSVDFQRITRRYILEERLKVLDRRHIAVVDFESCSGKGCLFTILCLSHVGSPQIFTKGGEGGQLSKGGSQEIAYILAFKAFKNNFIYRPRIVRL
jgi:hypothetical protein